MGATVYGTTGSASGQRLIRTSSPAPSAGTLMDASPSPAALQFGTEQIHECGEQSARLVRRVPRCQPNGEGQLRSIEPANHRVDWSWRDAGRRNDRDIEPFSDGGHQSVQTADLDARIGICSMSS